MLRTRTATTTRIAGTAPRQRQLPAGTIALAQPWPTLVATIGSNATWRASGDLRGGTSALVGRRRLAGVSAAILPRRRVLTGRWLDSAANGGASGGGVWLGRRAALPLAGPHGAREIAEGVG